jgi:hypothetical protein
MLSTRVEVLKEQPLNPLQTSSSASLDRRSQGRRIQFVESPHHQKARTLDQQAHRADRPLPEAGPRRSIDPKRAAGKESSQRTAEDFLTDRAPFAKCPPRAKRPEPGRRLKSAMQSRDRRPPELESQDQVRNETASLTARQKESSAL